MVASAWNWWRLALTLETIAALIAWRRV